MTKRRNNRSSKQPTTPIDGEQLQPEKKGASSTDQELERQIAAVKAISDMEVEHLLTGVRLLRSYFNEEQLEIPVLQFFKEKLPNVSIVRSGDENFDLQWKYEDGNLSMCNTNQMNVHASLLHRISMAYPSCSAARQSIGGYQVSAQAARTVVGADDLQMGNYMSLESLNTLMLGLPEGLQTPGINSQRLSIGMTPKSLRLPKPGEMILSVHGSPLGAYKEDNNMEAIHESEEGIV